MTTVECSRCRTEFDATPGTAARCPSCGEQHDVDETCTGSDAVHAEADDGAAVLEVHIHVHTHD